MFPPRFYRKVFLEVLNKCLLYLKVPMNSFGKGVSVDSPAPVMDFRRWGNRLLAITLSHLNSDQLGHPAYATDINYPNA